MASSFPAWCYPCCSVQQFSVRAVLGTVKRGEIEDLLVRSKCPRCHRMCEGVVRKGER